MPRTPPFHPRIQAKHPNAVLSKSPEATLNVDTRAIHMRDLLHAGCTLLTQIPDFVSGQMSKGSDEGTDICASVHVQSIFLKPLLPSPTTRTKLLLKKCTAILAFNIRRSSEVVIEATRSISSKFEICAMVFASRRTTLSSEKCRSAKLDVLRY